MKTYDKFDAIHALINTLLKDTTSYCNNCNVTFNPDNPIACCSEPQIGTHADHIRAVAEQNAHIRHTRANKYASTKNKSLRLGASFPPRFLFELERAWRKTNPHEKLFNGSKDLHKFMKRFKVFTIPEKV